MLPWAEVTVTESLKLVFAVGQKWNYHYDLEIEVSLTPEFEVSVSLRIESHDLKLGVDDVNKISTSRSDMITCITGTRKR